MPKGYTVDDLRTHLSYFKGDYYTEEHPDHKVIYLRFYKLKLAEQAYDYLVSKSPFGNIEIVTHNKKKKEENKKGKEVIVDDEGFILAK